MAFFGHLRRAIDSTGGPVGDLGAYRRESLESMGYSGKNTKMKPLTKFSKNQNDCPPPTLLMARAKPQKMSRGSRGLDFGLGRWGKA